MNHSLISVTELLAAILIIWSQFLHFKYLRNFTNCISLSIRAATIRQL